MRKDCTGIRLAAMLGIALWVLAGAPVQAQVGSDRYASVVVDARTGAVLSAVNADEERFPASLTKVMTLYMVFEALREGRIAMHQPVPVSAHAASMPPSRLGLRPGVHITVEEAVLALIARSANDASAALGELLGGTEERFAQMMTLRARALGLRNTTFRNASGLPNWNQVTSARDMALLARRLIADFPDRYALFATEEFGWNGRRLINHNRFLYEYEGADGIKTGWITESGHNLVASAVRGGVRLIGVVLGAGSTHERLRHMTDIMDAGFERSGVAIARREPVEPPPRRLALVSSARAASRATAARRPAASRAVAARPAARATAARRAPVRAASRPAVSRPVASRPAARRAAAAQPPARAAAARRAPVVAQGDAAGACAPRDRRAACAAPRRATTRR
jgi:D-alanyl-D-alanine carboxypeptidase